MLSTILIVIVLLILIGAVLPHWGYSSGWGYGYWPSGIIGLLLLIFIVLLLTGHVGHL